MKKMILMILALSFLTIGKNAIASVSQFEHLPVFFDTVSEIASDGASLAFFGYSEKRRAIKKSDCSKATTKEIAQYFEEIVDTVSYDDRLSKKLITLAKKDWMQLFSKEAFEICSETTSGHMTIGHITILRSKNYFIEFEFGYED